MAETRNVLDGLVVVKHSGSKFVQKARSVIKVEKIQVG
jgi:hypothetical protein